MSVKMEVKLNEEQTRKVKKSISINDIMRCKTIDEAYRELHDSIVEQVIVESGYHPAGYGAWDYNIIQKIEEGEEVFYATWYRSETCH